MYDTFVVFRVTLLVLGCLFSALMAIW